MQIVGELKKGKTKTDSAIIAQFSENSKERWFILLPDECSK